MKTFRCRVCDNALYFENSSCLSCGTRLGFSRSEKAIVPVEEVGRYVDADGAEWWMCSNIAVAGCTWLTAVNGDLCSSCMLTRTRPNDADLEGQILTEFQQTEAAKRYLLVELDRVGFPVVTRQDDPELGLCFDLLSSAAENVVIGHADGVITIDLAESDDAYREKVRAQLGEAYRTMLGHLRHEVGHYMEQLLVSGGEVQTRCRELFGDDTTSYQAEIDRHYAEGPPDGWEASYITTYATMHPFEDFAECFAHFLHISDTVDTAAAQGLVSVQPAAFSLFRDLVLGVWVPLSIGLNQINRAMGKDDLYPFVIPAPVLDKLEFVAALAKGRA